MNGRAFDAQVVLSPPDSTLGKLLQQYVCARIIRMDGIDLGLFDFDRHNALYYFIMNADEEIYMRYGGRDSTSATTYLNMRSLERALRQGIEMHDNPERQPAARPAPLFAKDIPLLRKQTAWQGACVECHLIADYDLLQKELDGTLDRVRDMYRSPDIKTIGIDLDVPAGLKVTNASAAVAAAGLEPGDEITHVNNTRVRTFGDLQYHYDKVPRDAVQVSFTVLRAGTEVAIDVELPKRWWVTDLKYRHLSVEPMVFFQTDPLSVEERASLNLPGDGFAGRVVERERFHDFANPPLKRGDVIFGVNGVTADELANTPELHIKLRHRAGSTLTLEVLRGDERFESELTTERQQFRKIER